jgi:hypothetical protein
MMQNEEREGLLVLIDIAIATCLSGLLVTLARMILGLFFDCCTTLG